LENCSWYFFFHFITFHRVGRFVLLREPVRVRKVQPERMAVTGTSDTLLKGAFTTTIMSFKNKRRLWHK
jgi:hypothetical protein